MFSNIISGNSSPGNDSLKNIYCRFQRFLGREVEASKENMQSADRSTDETFMTPGSSTVDLLTTSPTNNSYGGQNDTVDDLLTGAHFDTSHCDVTMHEAPLYDDMLHHIDATSIDYLVRCADSNRNHRELDRGKESLYVKFDPLYAKQRQENIAMQINSLSNFNEYDIGYETGSTASVATDSQVDSPKRCVSVDSIALCGKDKPTQIVLPAVKLEPSAHNLSLRRSTPALVRSVSAIMAPTRVAIDNLISISDNTTPTPMRYNADQFNSRQMDHLQSLRLLLQKQDQEMQALRHENRELKANLQYSERKTTRTQEDLEAKVKKLTDEKTNLIEKEARLMQQIQDKVLSNKQMCVVMEEYEKTISSLIGDQQKDKVHLKEFEHQMRAERDDALLHLTNMEAAFNDLLAKYEKCKTVLVELKDREKSFTEQIEEYEEAMKKYDSLYNNLKEVTTDSLNKANETLESINKNHSMEVAKLQATTKKHELTISSLQESLTQKIRENEGLTKICDQLIGAVQ